MCLAEINRVSRIENLMLPNNMKKEVIKNQNNQNSKLTFRKIGLHGQVG